MQVSSNVRTLNLCYDNQQVSCPHSAWTGFSRSQKSCRNVTKLAKNRIKIHKNMEGGTHRDRFCFPQAGRSLSSVLLEMKTCFDFVFFFFHSECPDLYTEYKYRCYRFFPNRKSWDEAYGICLGHGGSLAEIVDVAENTFVNALRVGANSWDFFEHQVHSEYQILISLPTRPSEKRSVSFLQKCLAWLSKGRCLRRFHVGQRQAK